ncbi:MAG: putative toxin-antitoxin system toxin component, PIN family [Betaproteobacteria bacterium]|nr:putative toxin-antitoxin system toxin component, PIN family [Betaproteobacteria bacterium]MBI2958735.1 putative toxin-antitoxin system toxin component, PIN family [Betaproteobacteria bacterium]
MRLVVDTNVAVSALLWGGVPRQLLDAIHQGRATAFTSGDLIREFREVLAREKFAATIAQFGKTPQSLAESYTGIAILVDPAPLLELGALRDPKDALVLACAVAARADAIVSGDIDLGVLKSFGDIPILTPAQCLERMAA